ncbi:pentatricopeptide repeat-containing protein At4g18840-like [Cryptomeria japonica]|uniref:pentatricopeptide repeat-containing protein At4g18840-like n=1 Tax=Cryptomeria japonica TaxID=3369 RepID=UPI0025ABA4E3|nr:pentatricopeptide repeat-containing protein At4g18840-like [Cryptomeria japonica]
MARSMLDEAKLLDMYRKEDVHIAIYTLHIAQLRVKTKYTPYELWFGKPVSVKHFRFFGSKCFIKRHDESLGSFESLCDDGIVLDYSSHSKAYKCFNKRLKRIIESAHVKVDEKVQVNQEMQVDKDTLGEVEKESIESFSEIEIEVVKEEKGTSNESLEACIAKKEQAFLEGKQIHTHINERAFPFSASILLQNTIINLYDKCVSLFDARKVFDEIPQPNIFSWNMIIAAYKRHGLPQEALTLFHQMQVPKGYLRIGQSSSNLWPFGRTGVQPDHGVVDEALTIFEEMPQRDLVSWTAMIVGYAQNGLADKALEFFEKMELAGVRPDSSTFATILLVCAKIGVLDQGMKIHQRIAECGIYLVVVVTALVDMYAKCGSKDETNT